MGITLAKALKIKNKLIGEIKDIEKMIVSKNTIIINEKVDIGKHVNKYNVEKMYNELQDKTNKLINLKIAINDANSEIIHHIFSMGEYKSLLKFLSTIDIKEGVVNRGYLESNVNEYFSQIDDIKLNGMKKELQDKIDNIQDELDKHNHTTILDLEEKDFV